MLVGKSLPAHPTVPASRSKSCSQRCCAFISSGGHQSPQVAQPAARTRAASEVCQADIVAPVAGHLSGLFQLLDGPHIELSAQAQLNERLIHCSSWQELSALLDANLGILDFVNVSATWTRLAKLYESTGPNVFAGQRAPTAPPVQEPAFRQFLAQLIDVTAQQLRVFGVQALANVMWALSNADWQLEQHEPAVSELVHEWCGRVYDRMHELRAPDVSNISTAIGRLDDRWRPDFVVEFYRSVLHRDELLEHVHVTTLNNLLYGLSRARRRGLTHEGPATRRLLGQCVDRLLERADTEGTGLVPWRAAQLLYNCHKLKLRIKPHSYSVLMPLVAQLYADDPNPMDCWSISFVTAFVDAHRNVHPAVRPDLQPLYAYVERRMPEATASQLAMLSHAFCELRCPPPAPFWGHVFSRYLLAPPPLLTEPPQQPDQRLEVTQPHGQQQGQQEAEGEQHTAHRFQPQQQHLVPRQQQQQLSTAAQQQQQQLQLLLQLQQAHAQSHAPRQQPQAQHTQALQLQLSIHGQQLSPQGQPQPHGQLALEPHRSQYGHRQHPPPHLSQVRQQPQPQQPHQQQQQPHQQQQQPHQQQQQPHQQQQQPHKQQELAQQPVQFQQHQALRRVRRAVTAPDDDLSDPRTLHYVCWQAAKAGILPPRSFLRLYVDRVPPWLMRQANDVQVAQAVETLQLLRWVPRRELREVLCATLERRAPTSAIPLRRLLRWVQQQR